MPLDTSHAEDDQDVSVTKVRTVRVSDKLWEAAQEKAESQGETLAQVLRLALTAYRVDPAATVAALVDIRGNAR